MRKEYDFSNAIPNPYCRKGEIPFLLALDEATLGYFENLAKRLDRACPDLIAAYLSDCARQNRMPPQNDAN